MNRKRPSYPQKACAHCSKDYQPAWSSSKFCCFECQFWHSTKVSENGCIEWQGTRTAAGYGQVKYNGKTSRAHRVAWMIQLGEIPEGKLLMHQCDNPRCVNVAHLKPGTDKENMLECVARRRIAHGHRARWTKIGPENVQEVRHLIAIGMRLTDIAKKFGVQRTSIAQIADGKTYKYV